MATAEKEQKISPEQQAEVKQFENNINSLKNNQMEPDLFKKFRLENGIYGIRGKTDVQMIRVKIFWGGLTPNQLQTLADCADKYSNGVGHVTTRQNFQFHWVKLEDVPSLLQDIGNAGLTSREACGNTVRNVTACHFAGICNQEVFDVSPYADAVAKFFLRNPLNQNMPRKFKFAFSGCSVDCAITAIHDMGMIAVIKDVEGKKQKGFRVYLGGGLGGSPHIAKLLEDFTPVELLLPTCEAVIKIQDRLGNRKDKNKARLKFLVDTLGIDEIRRLVKEERDIAIATKSGSRSWDIPLPEEEKFEATNAQDGLPVKNEDKAYLRWLETNVISQKQQGFHAAIIRLPLGDITSKQMRDLASLIGEFEGVKIRTTVTQNIIARNIRGRDIYSFYQKLARLDLHKAGAARLIDITRCPGADTCNLAITRSKGLAMAVNEALIQEGPALEDIKNVTIKISGCFNSCGQHHIANIGFYGMSRIMEGKEVPHYALMLGGAIGEGSNTKFGRVILNIPAKNAPTAVVRLAKLYSDQKKIDEGFLDFVERCSKEKIKEFLADLCVLPPFNSDPEKYMDWGATEQFKLEIGKGECAA